jgi:low temperature requirement protein LtrA
MATDHRIPTNVMKRRGARRWLDVRTGLFFLAALTWLVGVMLDSGAVRWVAMGVAFAALLLGLLARRSLTRHESVAGAED